VLKEVNWNYVQCVFWGFNHCPLSADNWRAGVGVLVSSVLLRLEQLVAGAVLTLIAVGRVVGVDLARRASVLVVVHRVS